MKPSITVKQLAMNAAAVRKAVGANNASLGYIHEHGSPAAGIPARPHLIPGIHDIVPEAVKMLKDAAKGALRGDEGAVDRNLNKIGLMGVSAVQNRFVNNDWPPLKAETLDYQAQQKDDAGNAITNKKGEVKRKKSRRERGRPNPLIDTRQLLNSYTYVIRQRGGNLITGA